MWEVIAAVLATGIGITLLPFATSVASNWLDGRRSERTHRRELYEELMTLGTDPTDRDSHRRANELRLGLRAQMGPHDSDVRKATWKALTYAATEEENDVMRWWVFGYERAARKLARKVTAASATNREES